MLVHGTATPEYSQFCREHRWTLMLPEKELTGFMARWERAQELPGKFYGGGNGNWGYYKPGQGSGPGAYTTSLEGCTCPDAAREGRAPGGWCKHRLALWIYDRRLQRIMSGIVEQRNGHHPER